MARQTRIALALLLAFSAAGLAERVPGRYIVELEGDSVAEHTLRVKSRQGIRSAEASAQRSRIRDEQTRMRRSLSGRGKVLDSIETVGNALFLEISDDRAAALAALPGIKRVRPVRTVKMIMDRAVVVDKVVEAWARVGEDRAGAGVKIAIIDSGIDSGHVALQDPSLPMPSGFPKFSSAGDEQFTSPKVIVARSYVNMLSRRDPDMSARDRVGHGTALAMVAAGVRTTAPLATVSGVAPKAWLGNYKVFGSPTVNDSATDDAILKAIDDAVNDGMDIISLSLGSDVAPRLDDDAMVDAVERAVRSGVVVVAAAGNNGPDFGTVSSPGTAPSAITVGASRNDRTFGTGVAVDGLPAIAAVPGSGARPSAPVSGALADVSALDGNGLACSPFSPGSLSGRVALILRGTCTFESKLNNAEQAGAVAALVYAAPAAPEAFIMSVGAATLPAEMISYSSGVRLKELIAAQGTVNTTLRFTVGAVSQEADRLASFSATGPDVDAAIKPDLVAVGSDVYVATQSFDIRGDMYSASGFLLVDGTSFSTPLVAGAAAVLKAARPGLSAWQVRSLLIGTASPVAGVDGNPARIQQAGAGQLDLGAAVSATLAASPASISLGAGGPDPRRTITLTLTNTGTAAETYSITAVPRAGSQAPIPAQATVDIAPGAPVEIPVSWTGFGLAPGAHEGMLQITGSVTGAVTRVPYWYDVASGEAASIPLLSVTASGRRSAQLRNAILFRVVDSAGVPVAGIEPEVTAVAGAGAVTSVVSRDSESPGLFSVSLRLGAQAGVNTFRIRAGQAAVDVSINGQ